jgi:seryl-tRNA synthetase
MLELGILVEKRDEILTGLEKRLVDKKVLGYVDEIIALDQKRRKAIVKSEKHRSEINQLSKEIGELFKSGKAKESRGAEMAAEARERVAFLKKKLDKLEERLKKTEASIENYLYEIPMFLTNRFPQEQVKTTMRFFVTIRVNFQKW